MHLRRERIEAPHSHMMHAGDPAECYYLHHADGSFSRVQVRVENDDMMVELQQSSTHPMHLRGI